VTFPVYEWIQDATVTSPIGVLEVVKRDVKHTRIILKLAKFYAHVDSSSRISPKYYCNSSEKKAKFSTAANSAKMSANKCEIDQQPEIAISPPKPEVLIIPKV